MKKILAVVGRFFVRTWFWNRNYELRRQHKAFLKAFRKRSALWQHLDIDTKKEWLKTDAVWKNAHEFFHELERVFEAKGNG